jgi:drug/metabolite transporter, DME family
VDAARRPAVHRPVIGAALVLGAASFWATFGIFARHLYDAGFQPIELASVRATVGFVAVAAFALARRSTRASVRAGTGALPFLIAYGALGYALFTIVYLSALERASVAVAAALLYTAPAFVLVMSTVLWRERVTGIRLVSMALVLAGVLLVTGAAGSLLRGTAALPPVALLAGIAAGLTYAVYTMFSKVSTDRFGPVASLFWSFGVAAVLLALVAPPHLPFLRAPGQALPLLALGIVPTVIPYALYLAGLRALRASTAAMLASVEPMIAALLAAALLHEPLEPLQGAGMLFIVAAAVLLSRQARTQGQRDVTQA